MIKYNQLDVEYDCVIAFDFLSDEERQSKQIAISLAETFKKMNCCLRVYKLNDGKEFYTILNSLKKEVKSGQKFMFHFIAHGNKDGIGFKHTREFISWDDLEKILTLINSHSENTLVLNLTSCYGLNGIHTVNPFSSDSPFFGLIGYTEKLKSKTSKQANDIFYSAVIKGEKINDALRLVQKSLKDKNFHCITSQGFAYLKKLKK